MSGGGYGPPPNSSSSGRGAGGSRTLLRPMGGPAAAATIGQRTCLHVAGAGECPNLNEIRSIFSKYGPVKGVRTHKNATFVDFHESAHAAAALVEHGHNLGDGRILDVCVAKSQTRYSDGRFQTVSSVGGGPGHNGTHQGRGGDRKRPADDYSDDRRGTSRMRRSSPPLRGGGSGGDLRRRSDRPLTPPSRRYGPPPQLDAGPEFQVIALNAGRCRDFGYYVIDLVEREIGINGRLMVLPEDVGVVDVLSDLVRSAMPYACVITQKGEARRELDLRILRHRPPRPYNDLSPEALLDVLRSEHRVSSLDHNGGSVAPISSSIVPPPQQRHSHNHQLHPSGYPPQYSTPTAQQQRSTSPRSTHYPPPAGSHVPQRTGPTQYYSQPPPAAPLTPATVPSLLPSQPQQPTYAYHQQQSQQQPPPQQPQQYVPQQQQYLSQTSPQPSDGGEAVRQQAQLQASILALLQAQTQQVQQQPQPAQQAQNQYIPQSHQQTPQQVAPATGYTVPLTQQGQPTNGAASSASVAAFDVSSALDTLIQQQSKQSSTTAGNGSSAVGGGGGSSYLSTLLHAKQQQSHIK